MFIAHCDESYSGDLSATPFYVVAGFCGPAQSWLAFANYWRSTMRELGVEEIGLHASKCANGAPPYDRLPSAARRELQHRLIVDIAASKPLMGFVACVDMPAFEKHAASVKAELGRDLAKYHVPHVAAMEVCVELIAQILEDVVDNRIAFVFDRNKQFGGRAAEWYQRNIDRPLAKHHLKLGGFSHGDRMADVGLQAADLLAYSAFRHFKDATFECWQWQELHQAAHIVQFVADGDFWSVPDKGMQL